MTTENKERQAKATTIFIDGDEYEVEDREMTMAELLALVDLDPNQSYLIELRGEGQELDHTDPDEQIKLRHRMKFLTGDRGPGQFA